MVTVKAKAAFAEVIMPLAATDLESIAPKNPDDTPATVIKCNGLTVELYSNITEVLLSHLLQNSCKK